MKKLILLISILLIVGGCSQDYNDIKPEKPITGTVVNIDSTKWTPVLMQVDSDKLIILDNQEIKTIYIIDPVIYLALALSIVIAFLMFIAAISGR